MGTELVERTPGLLASTVEIPSWSPTWLRDLRRAALAVHEELGIPTIKHEEWKYTSLRELASKSFAQAPELVLNSSDIDEFLFGGAEQLKLVFVNGRFSESLSSSFGDISGAEIHTLPVLAEERPEWLESHLGVLSKFDEFTFAALNTAAFDDGICIRVLRNAKVDTPIHILFVTSRAGESATFPRVLLVAEEGSEAFVIEQYASAGAPVGFSDAVTEVFVASNAKLEHVKVQRESRSSFHVALTQVKLERDSTYLTFNVNYGGHLVRNDLNVFLNGENLHCRMDGVVVLDGDQHCDNHTRLDHAFPNCDSFEVYKHVLNDKATAVFNGKIFVHQDAQKTDAKQTNQTLLLSPTATIDSKPQLEIFADDVKCTHGATIGQLRQDAMFYLRSRGLPETEARALLVYAFAAEVLEKISNEAVRKDLERQLFEKLGSRK